MGALLTSLLGLGGKVLDRVLPDKVKAQDQAHDERMGQQEINKIEAGHQSLFVAGARAFLMWALGAAFVYQMIIVQIANAYGAHLPEVDMKYAYQLLLVLLGAG